MICCCNPTIWEVILEQISLGLVLVRLLSARKSYCCISDRSIIDNIFIRWNNTSLNKVATTHFPCISFDHQYYETQSIHPRLQHLDPLLAVQQLLQEALKGGIGGCVLVVELGRVADIGHAVYIWFFEGVLFVQHLFFDGDNIFGILPFGVHCLLLLPYAHNNIFGFFATEGFTGVEAHVEVFHIVGCFLSFPHIEGEFFLLQYVLIIEDGE